MITMPLSQVQSNLSHIVDLVAGTRDRVVITRNGSPAVVVLSVDEVEALEETVAVLADSHTWSELQEAQRAVARVELTPIEEVPDPRSYRCS
jgi:prevent-host-death family protein